LASGFEKVFLLSQEKKYLANAQELIRENLEPAEVDRIKCLTIEEFIEFLEQEEAKSAEKEQIIGGRKVRVRQRALSETEKKTRRRAITQTILQAMKRMKDKT
jgi:chaperonin GroEL (HSP60 family)